MTAVLLQLQPPPTDLVRPPDRAEDEFEPEIVDDLDALSASGRCSCAASDDNRY